MDNRYLEDINYMLGKLEDIHPCLYFKVEKDKLQEFVTNSLGEIKDDYDFLYIIRRILKQIGDAHTKCLVPKSMDVLLPLRLKIIDKKLYILNTSNEYSKYKFSQIIKINNVDIDKLFKDMEQTITYSTNGWLETIMEDYFTRVASILSLPSIENTSNKICYTLLKNNQGSILEFDSKGTYDLDFIKDNNYTISIDENNQFIRIVYNACYEPKPNAMNEFVAYIDSVAKVNGITKFIVDLRGNSGGNSSIIKPLIKYLKDNSDGLVTLIDKEVYSSGRFAIVDLKNTGSSFVGTEIGTQTNCFGNVVNFELPNKHYRINCSNTYWYLNENTSEMCGVHGKDEFAKFVLDKNNMKYFTSHVFGPDIYVENKIEDYKNAKDKELECAIQLSSKLSFDKDDAQIK